MSWWPSATHRRGSLEAVRGLAAIVVVLHHSFLAFAPIYTGYLGSDRGPKSQIGHWYFGVFNGSAAVMLFFLLSGFVLPLGFLRNRDPIVLVQGTLKRLPRLMLPVMLALLLSVFLWQSHLYFHVQAALITGSEWLGKMGFANAPTGLVPSYLDALRQGVVTFFTAEAYYNSALWTMRAEFLGSLVVFLGAGILVAAVEVRAGFALLLLGLAVAALGYIHLVPFIVGLYLSVLLGRHPVRLPWFVALGMIGVGFYGLGFVEAIGDYKWVAAIEAIWGGPGNSTTFVNSAGALLIIAGFATSPTLSRPLEGRIGWALGKLSFPLYLVHMPVLLSLSSFTLLKVLEMGLQGWTALQVVLAATFAGSLLLALPLAVIDDLWVRLVGAVAKRWFPRRGAAATVVAEEPVATAPSPSAPG